MKSKLCIDNYKNQKWINKNGKLHRDKDLPAVVAANGTKLWYKNGKLHREQDKPAIEYPDGYREWWKDGVYLSLQEVEALQHKWEAVRNGDTDRLTEELLNEL